MDPVSKHPIADELFAPGTIERASQAALADRRARGEIMTYYLEGWVVREFPGQRVVRLAPIGSFRAEDHPLDEPCGS